MIAVRAASIVALLAHRAAWILRVPLVLATGLATAVVVPLVVLPTGGTPQASSPAPRQAPAPQPTPGSPPADAGFTFMIVGADGQPARWPCSPIRVVYNPEGEPYPAAQDVADTSGIFDEAFGPGRVRFEGTTTRTPDTLEHDAPSGPTVVVGWVPNPSSLPNPGDPLTVGQGGPITRGATIVAGTVRLVASASLDPGLGPESWGAALLHELGHAAGNLGHVSDPSSAMTPALNPARPAGWSDGDLAALQFMASGCARQSGGSSLRLLERFCCSQTRPTTPQRRRHVTTSSADRSHPQPTDH